MVRNPLANAEYLGLIPGLKGSLEEGTATHSSILAWRIPMDRGAAKSLQPCPTLCGPIDGSPPGSPVPGILRARTLEWVTISFSNAWKWSRSVVSDSWQPRELQPTRLLRPWNFPGKSTRVNSTLVRCHCLLHRRAWWATINGITKSQTQLSE